MESNIKCAVIHLDGKCPWDTETTESYVYQASRGRNVAECWQGINRIHEETYKQGKADAKKDFLSHIDSVVKKYPAMTYSMIKELKDLESL